MEWVIAGLGLLLAFVQPYIQEAHIGRGNTLKSKIEELAKKIYSKISNNQTAMDKLVSALQNRNSNLVNALFNQAGFGPAIAALNKEIKSVEAKIAAEKQKTTAENTELQNQYNKLVNAEAQLGTIAGNKYARETYNQVGQSVQGGLDDYTFSPAGYSDSDAANEHYEQHGYYPAKVDHPSNPSAQRL